MQPTIINEINLTLGRSAPDMRRNRIDHVAKLSLAPAGSFRPLLNFLESFLQLRSGLPLFSHIHDGADNFNDFARLIHYRMSDSAKALYGSVRKDDSKISLRVYPVLLCGLHFRLLLDLWSILRMNPFQELQPSGPHFVGRIVINAINLFRPEENVSTHIPGPTACMGQFLCFRQVTLTPPKGLSPLFNLTESLFQFASRLPCFVIGRRVLDCNGDLAGNPAEKIQLLFGEGIRSEPS